MTELVSSLVPLDTLAGWPAAPHFSVLDLLGLLVGVPALAFLVVFGISWINKLVKGDAADLAVTDAVWIGGRKVEAIETGESQGQAAIEAGPGAERAVGGAGARW